MKKLLQLSAFICLFVLANSAFAQIKTDSLKTYIIKKSDGTEVVARIISQDMREIVVETKTMGRFIIPKYAVVDIREAKSIDLSENGDVKPKELFNTRYFITTNGLPIKKGDSYLLWNLYGPDFQFGVGKNFGMGITTTWLGFPVVANAKYSITLSDYVHVGVGSLFGSGTYLAPKFYMALPFAALTFGDNSASVNMSGGYGYVGLNGNSGGRGLFSLAAMFKVGRIVSIVFDSFIVAKGQSTYDVVVQSSTNPTTGQVTTFTNTIENRKPGIALIIPGLRFQVDQNKAFQFGFMGISSDNEWLPIPIPMVQWFRKL